jgi:MbtH protein
MIDDPEQRFRVVINDEKQYSIWFAETDPPAGWREDGFQGTKSECLRHIESVWTDMRPRSVRTAPHQQSR